MVETKRFSNAFHQMHGCMHVYQRGNNYYQHEGKLQKSQQTVCPHKNSLYSFLAKVIFFTVLMLTCFLNLKIAYNTKLEYDKHQSIYSLDKLGFRPIDEDYNTVHAINNNNTHGDGNPSKLHLRVISSKVSVKVLVNDEQVYADELPAANRGIHIVLLNQQNGFVMGSRVFDTYSDNQDDELSLYLGHVSDDNRLIVFAVKDEGSYKLSDAVRHQIEMLGSTKIGLLGWRCMWAFVVSSKGVPMGEHIEVNVDVDSWPPPADLQVTLEPLDTKDFSTCNWPNTIENQRRIIFCSQYDGYKDICNCKISNALPFKYTNFHHNLVYDIPVAIIASNRPHYLSRCLTSVLNADGVNPKMITVFIDGQFSETMEVTKLYGVKGIYHTPVGVKNARVSQNYRASLSAIFGFNPNANYAIVIEDDLQVSPDFFQYFSQTIELLDIDSSLYCISAWNDQGYEHSSEDETLLYRVETMPGLGWMLKRSLFKNELEMQWPDPEQQWDWDMWMRHKDIRKGRECIIPDVSRTYHFGETGVNMNSYFFKLYFKRHKLNQKSNVTLQNVNQLEKINYEKLMHKLIREATVADHSLSPCTGEMFQNIMPEQNVVIYFEMSHGSDTEIFLNILKCLKLWDLDVRGLHNYSFRTFINSVHTLWIGYPVSPYSIYKPLNVDPVSFTDIQM